MLGTRRHGEANAILEVMTREHGRHLGLVRGGSASRLRPVLQPGNVVRAVWRARLDEHLGHYTVEPLQLHAASLLAASHVVYGVTHLAALCRLLPERDPHPEVHEWLSAVLAQLDDPLAAGAEVVRFELRMLAELGFGLDLSSCAATGDEDDLGYVSPKSGRAVSRGAGEPWHDRLLRLPSFVMERPEPARHRAADLADGFALTGFFLARHVLEPRGLSFADAREGFVAAVLGRRGRQPSGRSSAALAARVVAPGACRTGASCTCARTGRLAGPTTRSGVYGVYCLVARRSVACESGTPARSKPTAAKTAIRTLFTVLTPRSSFASWTSRVTALTMKVPHRRCRCKQHKRRLCR